MAELLWCLNLCLRDKQSENELLPQGKSHLVDFLLQTEIPTLKGKLQKRTKKLGPINLHVWNLVKAHPLSP